MPAVVGTVELAPHQVLRLALEELTGRRCIDVRVCEPFAGPAKLMTGTKIGFTLPVENIGKLIDALSEAERQARALGWVGD
jgi:hypothetical protein